MSYTPDVSMFPYWKTDLKDMKDELYDLREFKKDAEDTCASHVVMEDLMKRVVSAEQHQKQLKIINKQKQTRIDEVESEVEELTDALHNSGNFKCQGCDVWCATSMRSDQPFNVLDYAGYSLEFCQECVEDSDKVAECDNCGQYCEWDFIADYQGNNYCETCEQQALEEQSDEED